ncbi:hypothetical protein Nepgr_015395 [Nepenthes gracilis]|uniref:BHLH domain-containing protein n=1 Tax=Nepenthes gracilis TaxID=150966 RepID=A0AAD3SMT9_NEPGR|nr:hypothetical protein Nepgr_015395 [Nepenthes gracilis]
MVEDNGSWLCHQHSVQRSPNLSFMIPQFEPKQHDRLPAYINPCRVSSNVSLNAYGVSGLPARCPMLEIQMSHLTPNPFHNEKQFLLPTGQDEKPLLCEASYLQQKRYLIFDQSGNKTRLILSSLCFPAQNPNPAVRKSICANEFPVVGHPVKPKLQENDIVVKGKDDSYGDTDDIDALLCSDDEDIDVDEGNFNGEDDEEVSTGHSPFAVKEDCTKQELLKDDTEEVNSSEGSSKRRKALYGGYCEIPVKDHAKVIRQHGIHEAESRADFDCPEEMGPMVGSKWPRKDKIRDKLRVLRSIIPGGKGKDPFLVLDEAIDYLKWLKCQATSLPLGNPESSRCYQPLN